MGSESLEITKCRIIDGHSPTYNFGWMPHGWIKSKGNNQKLVAAGKRSRGRRIDAAELAATDANSSIATPTSRDGDVRAADWMGLPWREAEASPPATDAVGV